MIGKLKGLVDSVSEGGIILDVQGVGYTVACSAHTLRRVEGVGTALALLIETHVREDAISLYGFYDAVERDAFRLLTTVQGVGAKVALALLGALGPARLGQAIMAGDKTILTQADGVGPKLALRLVTELKDKMAAFAAPVAARGEGKAAPSGSMSPVAGGAMADAVSALVNLGYARVDAFTAVATAQGELGEAAPVEGLIRTALGGLGRKERG